MHIVIPTTSKVQPEKPVETVTTSSDASFLRSSGMHLVAEHLDYPGFDGALTFMSVIADGGRMVIALEWAGDFEAPWWHCDRNEKDIKVRSKQRQQSLWECLVAMHRDHGDCRLMLMEGCNPNRNLTFDLAEEMETEWWKPDESAKSGTSESLAAA